MSRVLITCRMQIASRLLAAIVVAPSLVILGSYVSIASIKSGGSWVVTLIAIIVGLVGLLSPFSEHRYQLIVTDQFVQQRGWRRTRIEYSEISEVDVQPRGLTLKGRGKKISTPGAIENREKTLRIIAEQLRSIPGLKLSGDKRRITELFGTS